jgi:succinyl-CoA synthetase alpha subunit
MDKLIIRKDTYFDSVFLMSISAELGKVQGVQLGQVMLATAANRQLLTGQGFASSELEGLTPTDLLVALRAAEASALERAEARLAELLSRRTTQSATEGPAVVGLDGALRAMPDANLVLISVPGEYAAYEARKALRAGLHVMVFSDNVSVEDEIALKQEAVSAGKLLMGPDCGTAIIEGVMLGFANQVRRGVIGVVGASGTGTQEVTCLIDRAGHGISHAIGTGGRDLSEKVGGITTLFALDMLARDPGTEVIVVVSKPPARPVADKVLAKLASLGKPSVVHFVGTPRSDVQGSIHFAPDLQAAAWQAVRLSNGIVPSEPAGMQARIAAERKALGPAQKWLRGLFTGGTMGAEALAFLQAKGWKLRSNLSHGAEEQGQERGHEVIDLGDDEFTRGRPHPMIEPAPRVERLMQEACDETMAVVLLDVVLGTGSHSDPAGAMVPAIEHARKEAARRGGYLPVVASVTGTANDRQGLASQIAKLERAGVVVLGSNIEAVRFAHALLEGRHV